MNSRRPDSIDRWSLFFKFVEPDGSIPELCLYLCLFPVIRAVPCPADSRIAVPVITSHEYLLHVHYYECSGSSMTTDQWGVRVPTGKGEEVRQALLREGALDLTLKVLHDGDALVFPVL